ncbi:retrotransposon-related protein [Tanacetum coccineum]
MVATHTNPGVDDATKQFINDAIQEAITAAFNALQQRIDGVCVRQENMANEMQNQNNGQLVGGNQANRVNGYGRLTKLDFPKFSGDDVKGWIYMCNQFFQLDNMADNQKVKIASIHLHNKALDWHRNFERRNGLEVTWERYSEEVLQRFGPIVEDPMAYLKNLKQTSTIKVYQDEFDALLSKVDITESQAVSMFLGGMNTDIAMMVRMFKPRTLSDTYCLANLQEATNESRIKSKPVYTSYKNVASTSSGSYGGGNVTSSNNKPLLALPATKQSLNPGRRHGQMFVLEVLTTSDGEDKEFSGEEECLVEEFSHTMRVKGQANRQPVNILVDCRSTHNFLDLHKAKQLGCDLKATCPLQISVAGGSQLVSQYVCKSFKWKLQGETFESDFMILPLGGCEMVLGIQFLATLGDIKCNFQELRMEFKLNGKKVVLRGTRQSELQWMQGRSMSKQMEGQHKEMYSVWHSISLNLMQGNNEQLHTENQGLLEEYDDVFAIPKCLPPNRSLDQRIPLKEGVTTINIRPYRYPPAQKDIIKEMVKELLDSGSDEAIESFHALQQAMVNSPVLALPNFDKEFIIETDASGYGVGVVLQQEGHPIAFLSKTLAPKHQSLAAYEKELLAMVLALQKWRGYLLDRHFKIRTDHFSLIHVLNQRITTPFQAKWLPKLIGFDYEIDYKKGKDNVVADALSRVQQPGQLFQILLTVDSSELVEAVKATWSSDPALKSMILSLQQGHYKNSRYTWFANELRRKGKLVVGNDEQLRLKLVSHFHESPTGGHSGVQATMKRLAAYFYWKGLKKMVKQQIHLCDICQRNKPDLAAYPGLLQPLQIPTKVWHDISMDFIEALPLSQNKSVIFVVVDRLSKYAHFIPLSHPYIASHVAQAFLDNVYKLHGLPATIVSDRDKVFLSLFWQSLFKMLKVQLCERPKEWTKWLSLAEYWYNTNFHNSIKTIPFEVLYGQTPLIHTPYVAKDSFVELVDRTLQAREQAITMLKFHLKAAQDRMKTYADKKRSEKEFAVGDLVYLKLQPYIQLTLKVHKQHKLSTKKFGPFKVLQKIGRVAYKLELPSTANIHPVFHVSLLKKCYSIDLSMGSLLLCDSEGSLVVVPYKILDRKLAKQDNRVVVYGLIQWTNGSVENSTWELLTDIEKRFPTFDIDP